MRRIQSIDQRCQQHVLAASESTALRDQALSQAASMLQDDDTTRAPMDAIEVVQLHHLHKMQEQATTTTRSLGGTAILAERASKQVKQLDFLLSRVTQTREIAHALQQQSANIQRISGAIEANDLEAATECVQRYEEAKRLLSSMRTDTASTSSAPPTATPTRVEGNGRSSPHDDDTGDVVVVDREAIMQSAKSEVAKLVRSQLTSAIGMNDKLKIVKLTAMLSALGFRDESCEAYTSWICDHTIAQLKVMVSRELRNMDDPTAAGMSHLTLVSNALDHVVAAMEQEQPHVTEAFGPEGHLKLLQLLHSRCTHHCVPVVKDFLEKRKVPNRRSARGAPAASPERPSKSSSPPPTASAPSPPLDPRKIDECLEDISHLVSCCSLYMSFIENEMAKAVGAAAAASGQRTESVRRAQYLALATKDNALFDTIQELLSIYIPLQSEYFDAAFQQAVKLQHSLLRGGGGGRHGAPAMGASNKGPSTSGQTFMGALSSLYGANEEDPDGEDAAQHEHNPHELPPISVVDDVFYFVRIAVHRAAGTKSTSILSAIIIAVVELIQSKLLVEITNHIQSQLKKMPATPNTGSSGSLPGGASSGSIDATGAGHFATHHANIPAKALAWLCAAKQCQQYTCKIAEELHRLVMDHFPQPDELIRFGEQRHDIDLLAKSVDETVTQWAGKVAAITAQGWMHKAGERLMATSYVVDDAQFYQFDLADPWAIAATVGWGHALDFLGRCVTQDAVRELLVVEICSRVVRILEELVCKKKYSAYGALQLDKDVRTVRQFFVERTERPVRELFGRLHAIASILLVDRPQEVSTMYMPDATASSAVVLSVEDKRRFLSMRVEFDYADITANVTS